MKTQLPYFKLTFFKNILAASILFCALPGAVLSQVRNTGSINISGIVYLNSSFNNVVGASYLNNGNFYLTGDFTNSQGFLAEGLGTTIFTGTGIQNINGTANSAFYNIVINNSSIVTAFQNFTVGGNWTNNGGFTHGSKKVTFDATGGTQLITGTSNSTFYDLTQDNSGAILNFGSLTTTIDHDFRVNNGTMDGGTSTVIFTGNQPGLISGPGSKNFYNVQFNPGAIVTDLTASDGNIHVDNSYTNNGTSFTQHNTHTIYFDKSGATETISGTGATTFGNLTVGGAALSFPTTLNSGTHGFTITGTSFQFNNNSSIFNNTGGTVTFNATSGATAIKNAASVSGTLATFNNATVNSGTDLTINADATVNNIFNVAGIANSATIGTATLTLNGTITGAGMLAGTNTGKLVIGGSSGGSVGTLSFKTGSQLLNSFTINRTGVGPRADLGSDLTTSNLTLTNGIVTTDANLFTWDKALGTLGAPNMPFATNNNTYSNSYVCTCTPLGTSVAFATPYTGNFGFQVKNVSGNSDVYFPVGSDLVSANRMTINMNNSANRDFAVNVGKGDIINTPDPRVNRIWYVHASDTTGVRSTMKLFFTKRTDFINWPSPEDEVEPSFPYASVRLIQKYYDSTNFINISSGADMQTTWAGFTVGTEVYALYTKGVSQAFDLSTKGITEFNEFSIIDGGDIVLPVTITNIKAWQDGNHVQVAWTSSNEINIDHYEVEKSLDAQHFIYLGKVQATNNGITANYQLTDIQPANGSNYYRIKVVDKNGAISYTSIVVVNLSKGIARIFIYPNPVQHRLFNLQFSNVDAGNYKLQVYDGGGRLVAVKQIEHFGGSATQQVILPAGTAAGVYKVILFNNDAVIYNTTLVVAD